MFFFIFLEDYDFDVELVALRGDNSIASAVRVDDMRAPIFRYILV